MALRSLTDEVMDNALHYAATKGHLPFVQILLKQGLRVTASDVHNATPLSRGVHHRRINFGRRLNYLYAGEGHKLGK